MHDSKHPRPKIAQGRPVLVPQAPVVFAGFREVLWLTADGEIAALDRAEARRRIERAMPMVCHVRATARRLDAPLFPALDLLELFAFVHPARFCVPTPRGLAEALGLTPPHGAADCCVTLLAAARALLERLAEETDIEARAVAAVMAEAGWPWGPAVLAALPEAAPE
ncbi:MAG TPA: ATP-dependent DNA helicase, partial [Stellaceae bacterium]|nr:ATP-dependent DNA helicase [Stellaceae bacterium]